MIKRKPKKRVRDTKAKKESGEVPGIRIRKEIGKIDAIRKKIGVRRLVGSMRIENISRKRELRRDRIHLNQSTHGLDQDHTEKRKTIQEAEPRIKNRRSANPSPKDQNNNLPTPSPQCIPT